MKILFSNLSLLIVGTLVVILAVMYGIDITTTYNVHGEQLEDRYEQQPLRVSKIEHTRGLMSLTNLPTKAFAHLKAVTLVFSMDGTRADPFTAKDA